MNIFMVSPRRGPEDRFTAHWAYLLHNHPDLGQRVVDYLCEAAGVAASRFIRADDHPDYGRADQPDMRLVCDDFDILVEHKLDADLGLDQLGRYARLAAPGRKTYLALVANRGDLRVTHPADAASENYLFAKAGHRLYFLWEELYPLVKGTSGRLAAEFTEYMASYGMEPMCIDGEIGDPFVSPVAAARFRGLYEAVKPLFARTGALRKVDPSSLGMQVQRPLDGLHLIYMSADKPGGRHLLHPVPGRCMYLQVFSMQGRPGIKSLGAPDTVFSAAGTGAQISVISPEIARSSRNGHCLLREYAMPLGSILVGEVAEAQRRLIEFVQACLMDLQVSVRVRTASSAERPPVDVGEADVDG